MRGLRSGASDGNGRAFYGFRYASARTIVHSIIIKVNLTYHMDRKVIIITRRITFEPTSYYCMDIGRDGGPYGYGPRGPKQRTAGRHLEAVIRPAA